MLLLEIHVSISRNCASVCGFGSIKSCSSCRTFEEGPATICAQLQTRYSRYTGRKTAQRNCNVTLEDSQTFCQSPLLMTKSCTGGRIEVPPSIDHFIFFFFLCRPRIKVKYLENRDILPQESISKMSPPNLLSTKL